MPTTQRNYLKPLTIIFEFYMGADFYRAEMNWTRDLADPKKWIVKRNEKEVGKIDYNSNLVPTVAHARDAVFMVHYNNGIDLDSLQKPSEVLEILTQGSRIVFIGSSKDNRHLQRGSIEIITDTEYMIKWDNPTDETGRKRIRWVKQRFVTSEKNFPND